MTIRFAPTLLTGTFPAAQGSPITVRSAARRIYVGTAAWANPPAQRAVRAAGISHLQHYASQFNAVEINSSFYRTHKQETYARWRQSTPAGFRFSVKAPRTLTHDCALRHCQAELRQFLQEVSGLGRKLSVILVQTPPALAFEARVTSRFFASLAAASPCAIACEPRHATWFTPKAEAILSRHGVARVAADPPRIPGADEPAAAPRLTYYRLHGSPRIYYSAYSAEFLEKLGARLAMSALESTEVWCVFDNTALHASWENALHVRNFLGTGRMQMTPARGSHP